MPMAMSASAAGGAIGTIEKVYAAFGGHIGLSIPDPRAYGTVNAFRQMGEVIRKRKITISSKVDFDQVQYPNYGDGDIWQIAAAMGASGSSSGMTSNQIKYGVVNPVKAPSAPPPARRHAPAVAPMVREYRNLDINPQIERYKNYTQSASFGVANSRGGGGGSVSAQARRVS